MDTLMSLIREINKLVALFSQNRLVGMKRCSLFVVFSPIIYTSLFYVLSTFLLKCSPQ